SIAFILQYLAGGTRWVESHLRILPVYWIGVGLLLALLTGVAAWLFGHPFLTSAFQYPEVALLGKVPMASALLFDLGDFVLVVGATVLILVALAHQSIRGPKPAKRPPPPIVVAPSQETGAPDGADHRPQRRGARRVRGVAAAAAALVPGHHRAVASVLCRQPLHLQHGPPEVRRAA